MLRNLQQAFFSLSPNHDVDVIRFQCLLRKKRWMPTAKDHRKIRIPALHRARYFHSLPNHRAGYQRNPQAQGVLHFLQNPLLVVGGDRRIDDLYRIAGPQQWRCHRQNTQRRCGL
jgi:hypothetical protein